MKLMIKKKFFDEIRKGRKPIEFRDAHLTFVAEETGETMRKNVEGVCIMPRGTTHRQLKEKISNSLFNKIFEDNFQIWFYLEEGGNYEDPKAKKDKKAGNL